jgi:hypothetical protein
VWSFAIRTLRNAQGERRVTQPLSKKKSPVCQTSTLKSGNTQHCVECWKYPPRCRVHAFTLALVFDATPWKASSVMLEMLNRIVCFISYIVCGLLLYTFSFEPPYRQKSDGAGSGDRGGHKFREIMLSPEDSRIIRNAEFAVCAVATAYCNQ